MKKHTFPSYVDAFDKNGSEENPDNPVTRQVTVKQKSVQHENYIGFLSKQIVNLNELAPCYECLSKWCMSKWDMEYAVVTYFMHVTK